MDELDSYDRKIIEVLREDARITVTDLAARVALSKTPCKIRMQRLEKAGYILKYAAITDPAKFDAGHIAFVQVTLRETTTKALEAFNEAAREVREIEQCHMIAAGFDYLLKVRTKDIAAYRRVLGEKVSSLPFVSQTSTFVVMEPVKDVGLGR